MNNVLSALEHVLQERRQSDPENSYVASLYAKGLNKVLEKVGEEAIEVIIAAKDAQRVPEKSSEVIAEVADLWFHTLVMLQALHLSHEDVLAELSKRFGLSGLEEKAKRGLGKT